MGVYCDMQKHRIVALLLAVMLTVSYTLGRSQTVRAATTLTAQQVDILYGLLASGGVIAAKEGTDSKKRQTITDWAASAPDASTWTATKYLDGWTADDSGNYHYTPSSDATLQDVKSWLAGLRTSVVDWINSKFSVSIPTAWTLYKDCWKYTRTNYDVVTVASGGGIYLLDTCWNRTKGNYSAHLTGVTVDGYAVNLDVIDSSGNVVCTPRNSSYVHGTYVGLDYSVKVYGHYGKTAATAATTGFDYFGVFLCDGDGNKVTSWGVANSSYTTNSNAVVAWGNGNAVGIGTCPIDGVLSAVGSVAGTIDTGIDCDTWSDTLSRDMVDDNKDVVILGGQDLAGYDTVDSVRSGYVTGVDWDATGNPDVPVPDDVPGKLDSILDFLKSLPALLGSTLIGSGSLDFSKFKDISLTGVFPFCIPFDLINSFKAFDVQALEPRWTVDLSGTPLEHGGNVEIDLTQYTDIFAIIRYFCYGSFVVGLICITRRLIKG